MKSPFPEGGWDVSTPALFHKELASIMRSSVDISDDDFGSDALGCKYFIEYFANHPEMLDAFTKAVRARNKQLCKNYK